MTKRKISNLAAPHSVFDTSQGKYNRETGTTCENHSIASLVLGCDDRITDSSINPLISMLKKTYLASATGYIV